MNSNLKLKLFLWENITSKIFPVVILMVSMTVYIMTFRFINGQSFVICFAANLEDNFT